MTNSQTCDAIKKSENVEPSSEKKVEVITIDDSTISDEVTNSSLLDNSILTNSQTCDAIKKSEKVQPSSEEKDEVITNQRDTDEKGND